MTTIVIGSIPAEEFALNHTLESVPEVSFECERIIESGDDAIMPLLWVRNADEDLLEQAFEEDPSVGAVTQLAAFEDERLYRMDWIRHVRLLLQMLTHSDATILEAYGRDGAWRLRVLFPTRDSFSGTHDFCHEHGLTFDIESIRDMEGEPSGRYGLTDAQYRALVEAVRRGYYDVPRGRRSRKSPRTSTSLTRPSRNAFDGGPSR
ncbi:helix-turn-helix domain-containing protein [Salinigranum rubrum]|uniref:helix-turn-helix domain-containing protein n=1 Tax=Salinigranum rubrum TaxID=755307 RepID=UPI001FE76AC7|nr:bacterio-opsin activator domain-containing protein [Salinigranum rubrum]